MFSQSITLIDHKRVHTGEKPNSCNICQKLFTQKSGLSKHCKSPDHLQWKERKNVDSSFHRTTFIDLGEVIKTEDIKEEISEEESDEII